MKGIQIRTRIQWYEEGEKPTSYFCHLENRNYTNKTINSLVIENGNELFDGHAIINEQKRFYENLYKNVLILILRVKTYFLI